jgi:hypothetical protein
MDNAYEKDYRRILAACAEAKTVKKPNFAALAREYSVSVWRLRARFNGRPSRSTRHMAYSRLNDLQIGSIVRWIDHLDALHILSTANMVVVSANAIFMLPIKTPARLARTGYTTLWQKSYQQGFIGYRKSLQTEIVSLLRILVS